MKNSYKDLNLEDLAKEREKLKNEYLELKFKKVLGTLDNNMRKRNLRKSIARLHTRINEILIKEANKE